MKLRHRIKWALTTEQWRTLRNISVGAGLFVVWLVSIASIALWLAAWGTVKGYTPIFLFSFLGGALVLWAAIMTILALGFLTVLLRPKTNKR